MSDIHQYREIRNTYLILLGKTYEEEVFEDVDAYEN